MFLLWFYIRSIWYYRRVVFRTHDGLKVIAVRPKGVSVEEYRVVIQKWLNVQGHDSTFKLVSWRTQALVTNIDVSTVEVY